MRNYLVTLKLILSLSSLAFAPLEALTWILRYPEYSHSSRMVELKYGFCLVTQEAPQL